MLLHSHQEIRLQEHTLDTLPRLAKLREEHLAARTEVCIERAAHMTAYLRDQTKSDEPMVLQYGKALNQFLSRKAPLFPDDNLLGGTTTSKVRGAPVYPEFTGMTIWPELDTISTRKQNPQLLAPADRDRLNFEIFPFWMERNILERARATYKNPKSMKLFEQFVFYIASKTGCISHTVPNYGQVLHEGIAGIMARAASRREELLATGNSDPETSRRLDFLEAVQIAMQGVLTYAANLSRKARELAGEESDAARRDNLLRIAEVCQQVPVHPARTFREAVNAVWLVQVAIHAENINMAISPGRLDQVLYPFFKADMDQGRLTMSEALELLGCLWLKLCDNTNLVPETAEQLFGGAGTVPAVTVGGVNEAGEDAVNDLTYLMLRVTELLRTKDPSMNARYHYEKNSPAYRDRVAEVIVNTRAVPAFHNDVVDIKTLTNQGTELEHARDYAVIGCVELAAAGRSYDASSSIMFNLVSALELALYNGKRPVTGDTRVGPESGSSDSFNSFEQFWEAFKKQLTWLLGQAIELNEMLGRTHQAVMPTPMLSAFFDGPLDSGDDLIFGGARYNSSGATHIGFADTVDSLNSIEQAVFIDRKCSFPELLEALRTNFAGQAELQQYLRNKTPKYGSSHPIAVKNSQNLVRFLYQFYQSHTNYRGGKYRPAYWTMTNHAGQGKLCGALPNGRLANTVFASGITPASQAAQELTTCLQAVGGLDSLCIPGGVALNLKYPQVQGQKDLERFGQAVEAYFRAGGMHIQFNIMDYAMLLDAKKHPENYEGLLVRVSGYSAYFNDLNEAMKDEIITRTQYDLRSGKAMPLPVDA